MVAKHARRAVSGAAQGAVPASATERSSPSGARTRGREGDKSERSEGEDVDELR